MRVQLQLVQYNPRRVSVCGETIFPGSRAWNTSTVWQQRLPSGSTLKFPEESLTPIVNPSARNSQTRSLSRQAWENVNGRSICAENRVIRQRDSPEFVQPHLLLPLEQFTSTVRVLYLPISLTAGESASRTYAQGANRSPLCFAEKAILASRTADELRRLTRFRAG